VPAIYEAAPLRIFPKPATEEKLEIHLAASEAATARGMLDPKLPEAPDVGFFGRDETLLALDRAFDNQQIVLLHAYAGSGKTTTAAEFARWYALTGGVDGPVLFTPFEQYRPLARVLDQIEQIFGPALEQAGVQWLSLTDAQRRQVALDVLQQIPVLWIWDNVEPVAGFPTGADSAWSDEEQQELADFLRAARDTKAKFLLTSRRDERAWLGDLPARISVPPMPMQERVQLARAIAEKHNRKLTDVEDWRPLLQFTRGNPLTITVLVGQALRDGLKSKEQIEAFVAQLRAGEAHFEDEAAQGRTKSLGASLSYGFEHAFTEAERKQLALLHFFQGFVDVDVLVMMGNPKADWSLPELYNLTRDHFITLLNRAAEIGLLTAHGGGYYTIHPALPWYFKSLFDQDYPAPAQDAEPDENQKSKIANPKSAATRAFVEAMGGLGDYYHQQYEGGNRGVIAALSAEEANLIHARSLALSKARQLVLSSAKRVSKGEADWYGPVIGTMQGLRALYEHTGRRAEWRRLVEEIVPEFVDLATDDPLPGREEPWSLVTGYRVRLAMEARQWTEAERLQQVRVEWNRQRATALMVLPSEALDSPQRNSVRSLAASLHELGVIQRELEQPECVAAYEESLTLTERIGERTGAAICAFNLGRAYGQVPTLRDLVQAEHWYQRSLDLVSEDDRIGKAKIYTELGSVSRERFKEARAAQAPEAELLRHLNAALGYYHQGLDLLPPNAVGDLGVVHNQLGNCYSEGGDIDRALNHLRESIRYKEMQGDLYNAANTRFNVAITLAQAGRLADAREYALAAQRNFETYGPRAATEIEQTRELVGQIEADMKGE
jgi:tetratricopeptide (TPR) repeat protein